MPIWIVLLFPLLFTAGMSLVDTTDSIMMLGAYGWAFVKPVRKLYYNMNITLVSVLVALVIGTVEFLSILADKLNLTGGLWGLGGQSGLRDDRLPDHRHLPDQLARLDAALPDQEVRQHRGYTGGVTASATIVRRELMTDQDRLAAYQATLIASGVRLTPQRFMVLEVLAASPGHTTAERVLAGVQARYPYVNKTTVYRTLELLSDLGMVVTTHSGGNQYEYELVEAPHHHLICKECRREIELPDTALNALRHLVDQEYGFRPCLDHFVMFGVCRECQNQSARRGIELAEAVRA